MDAIPLEDMDEISWKAKYLVHKDWNKTYLLNIRVSWTEDDYFNYAFKRVKDFNFEV